MPGPPRWRQPLLVLQSLSTQKLLSRTLDERVTNLLTFVQEQTRRNPEIVFGDGIERTRDSPESRAFCRRLAAEGMVLLKNDNNVLPLSSAKLKRVAVIGPNVKEHVVSGGGSAALKPTYVVSPWEGMTADPAGIEFIHLIGCYGKTVVKNPDSMSSFICSTAHKYLPTLENNLTTPSGEPGWLCTFYTRDRPDPVAKLTLHDTRIKLNDFLPSGLGSEWMMKLTGKLTFDKSAAYELGLTVAGSHSCSMIRHICS